MLRVIQPLLKSESNRKQGQTVHKTATERETDKETNKEENTTRQTDTQVNRQTVIQTKRHIGDLDTESNK